MEMFAREQKSTLKTQMEVIGLKITMTKIKGTL